LADSKKSSPLKPLGQMNRNLVESIYGRSSVKIAHFVPIRCEKLTDDRRRTPSDGKSSHCLWQGELKMHQNLMQNKNSTFLPNMQNFGI
jgi:hypothetical protein